MDALRPFWDAERPGLHSHAERGNDQSEAKKPRSFDQGFFMSGVSS